MQPVTSCTFEGFPAQRRNLKILTLGHSLAVDSCHFLALIAATEGDSGLSIATLYFSGCPLSKHVDYLTNNTPAYSLYVSNSAEPTVPKITPSVTMHDALLYDEWDVILMQGGTFEPAYDTTFQTGHIQTIQSYVNQYKRNPDAIFGWHMPWVFPTDPDLMAMYPYTPNGYVVGYEKFGGGRKELYQAITACMKKHILTNDTFRCLIPTGTAIENALSSYLTEKDIHRDYAHATDFGRVIAGYVWYCVLRGIDHLDEIKLPGIPAKYFRSNKGEEDILFTQQDKDLILEAVNNALKNPLQMTPSRYTETPAK